MSAWEVYTKMNNEMMVNDDFDENEVANNIVKKKFKVFDDDWKARWLCVLLSIYPQLSYMCSRAVGNVNRCISSSALGS